MDYKKALDKLRAAADEYDYDGYLEKGRESQPAEAEEVEREGLVRRPSTGDSIVPEDTEEELGRIAERFIQIRRMRKGK